MNNPFLSRAKKSSRQSSAYWYSKKQEKKRAKQLGGFRVSGSGSGLRKSDVTVPNALRVECKATQAESFRVTRKMLETAEYASLAAGEFPCVQIDFIDKTSAIDASYVVMPLWALDRLMERVNEKDNHHKAG